MKIRYVDHRTLQGCPAAADMDDKVIEINTSVWNDYDDFQQRFIIAHEAGHIKLNTGNELEADRYALHKVYGTAYKSLRRSLETLYKIGIVNEERYLSLYKEALKIDWERNGNLKAKKELEFINQENMKTRAAQANYIRSYNQPKEVSNKRAYRAYANGGEDTEANPIVCQSKSHKTNGVKIGDYYFSFTNILLAALLVSVIVLNSSVKKG
ncbi:ImmA/IrrE family metallo-endopeptidase [Bacteroidales bacterium OttesenSCG-928-C03]|nr:ImmA/IrrE family metallo-endopeptidase [Bacteroidales bacterium OttesenSCG-928-C03]MDL2326745.1 ImmA/IrrE family metallo-endopeptidase [Bacteroidales bacterium OttesenSCG-928-A14]